MIGVFGFALAFALMSVAQNFTMLILARALAGILSSATLPSAMAYIADTTEAKDRSRGVGMMGAAMGLGMIFGPMLGGFLSAVNPALPVGLQGLIQVTNDPETGALINLSVPFIFSAFLALLALPALYFFLPESFTPQMRLASAGQAKAQGSRFSQLLAALRGPVGFLFAMAFLLTFALTNLEAVLGLYGQLRFAMGPADIGLLMGAMGVLGVILQGGLIGPLTRRFGEANLLKSGLAISILGFLGMALLPFQAGMIAAALVYSVGSTLLNPSVTSLISQRTSPNEQGAVMGINNSFQSLGRSVGPLWAGFAFDLYPTLSFWSGVLFQAFGLFYALRMLGRSAPAPEAATQLETAVEKHGLPQA